LLIGVRFMRLIDRRQIISYELCFDRLNKLSPPPSPTVPPPPREDTILFHPVRQTPATPQEGNFYLLERKNPVIHDGGV
jgi:hypothetical protein